MDIAALRHRKFFSIAELHQAICELRDRINQRPFRKREGSRASQFAALDKPALNPLPADRFDLSQWSRARVNVQRVASHLRTRGHGHTVTIAEHRPRSHQEHLESTPSRMVQWGDSIGPHTARLFERIFTDKPHKEMGYRGCLGIIRLAAQYSSVVWKPLPSGRCPPGRAAIRL